MNNVGKRDKNVSVQAFYTLIFNYSMPDSRICCSLENSLCLESLVFVKTKKHTQFKRNNSIFRYFQIKDGIGNILLMSFY